LQDFISLFLVNYTVSVSLYCQFRPNLILITCKPARVVLFDVSYEHVSDDDDVSHLA